MSPKLNGKHVTGVPETLSSQFNLLAQIVQVQDKNSYCDNLVSMLCVIVKETDLYKQFTYFRIPLLIIYSLFDNYKNVLVYSLTINYVYINSSYGLSYYLQLINMFDHTQYFIAKKCLQ
jgi:hypothetical protein